MGYRKASLIALSVTLLLGGVFFFLSFELPMSMPGLVIGSGYYPRVLSGTLMISSALGLYFNYKKKENDALRINIQKPILFFFVLAVAFVLAFVWHLTGAFYPVFIAVVLAMLWVLNPEQTSKRKAGKTLLIATLLIGVIYGLF